MVSPVNQTNEHGREERPRRGAAQEQRGQDDHTPLEDDRGHGGRELQREDDRARRERDRCDCYVGVADSRYERVIKTFQLEAFNGLVDTGALDSGVNAWLMRFEALLGM
ncbi:hypothetical protein GN244_ATG09270 [Phytophthora infestans]|uniref:Uncharacterized protein n=1 Tax=Phytophthora infestans TaxID=4787 RepID=A0A833SUB3_PHYIN|nr:hypothetical protein GN244_ATG09270 [Phytophthora infestans]KAF4133515.1 hypothetical protein GN958_ATG17277 [Phytophthora infestans]